MTNCFTLHVESSLSFAVRITEINNYIKRGYQLLCNSYSHRYIVMYNFVLKLINYRIDIIRFYLDLYVVFLFFGRGGKWSAEVLLYHVPKSTNCTRPVHTSDSLHPTSVTLWGEGGVPT